jgi:hypothetical protein
MSTDAAEQRDRREFLENEKRLRQQREGPTSNTRILRMPVVVDLVSSTARR